MSGVIIKRPDSSKGDTPLITELDNQELINKLDAKFNAMVRNKAKPKKKAIKSFIKEKIDLINELDDY